jgi:predicted cupin superfamily sugar epimerase
MVHPLVERLGLVAHPEGGWYAETWRAATEVDTPAGTRPSATAILYLLEPGERSAWHRVRSDELWLHHTGGSLELTLGGDGDRPGLHPESLVLGSATDGHRPQVVVPGGHWQTARPLDDEAVLVSCFVSPGFDFADFELLED